MQLGKSQFGRQIKGKFQSVLLKEMPTPAFPGKGIVNTQG
jgi:hypothetical protein